MFQFTRPRGARLSLPWRLRMSVGFNSRAREGRDAFGVFLDLLCGVSIHAPARGATRRRRCSRASSHSFNSRAREGRDGRNSSIIGEQIEFQFTRPRGARLPVTAIIGVSK